MPRAQAEEALEAPADIAAGSTGEVAQLMGFGAFGDKKAQFRQFKKDLGLKEAIDATRREKTCGRHCM